MESSTARNTGWITFAGIVFMVAGAAHFIWGAGALADKEYLSEGGLLFSSLAFWGWVALVLGALMLAGAYLLLVNAPSAREIGIMLVVLSAIFWLFVLAVFPTFALAAILLVALTIYLLIGPGCRDESARRADGRVGKWGVPCVAVAVGLMVGGGFIVGPEDQGSKATTAGADRDGDGSAGFPVGDDCNDQDASIYTGAIDVPGDGIDQDCDGEDGLVDNDGDGFGAEGAAGGGDCNDDDSSIYPGAPEIPEDGVDQDCDGMDALIDNDGDGFGPPGSARGGDCNDNDPSIYPGARDRRGDGIDQDCDGEDG